MMSLPRSINFPPPVFKLGVRETVLAAKLLVYGFERMVEEGSDEELEETQDLAGRINGFLDEIGYAQMGDDE